MTPFLHCLAHRSIAVNGQPLPRLQYDPAIFKACPFCSLRLELWRSLMDKLPGLNPQLSSPCTLNGYIESNLLSLPRSWVKYVTNPRLAINGIIAKETFTPSQCALIEYWRSRRGHAIQHWSNLKPKTTKKSML